MIVVEEDNAPDTYVKKSSVEGYGLFASKDFNKDEIILNYNSFIKSFYKSKWSDLKPEQYNKNWLLPIDENYCLTNNRSCKFHFLNHSRTPNCDWQIKNLLIVANKNIQKDEELFIDYRLEYRPNRVNYPNWI